MKTLKKAIIAIIAGIISGLFSSGGGLILVPAFVYFLDLNDKNARGTAILCILPMVITSSVFYYKGKNIDWSVATMCAFGGIIGGIIGAKLLKKLPTIYVRIIFIFFLLYVGIRILLV